MTAFSFSSGDPTHLTSGANALMVDLSGPFADIKAYINGANLGVGNIAPNGVTAALIEAQQAWQTAAMTGWSASLPYMKNSLGFVHVRTDAITAPASVPQGTTIATLPAGYRPVTTIYGILIDTSLGGGGIYAMSIDTAGVISNRTALTGSKPYCFNFVPFRGEN